MQQRKGCNSPGFTDESNILHGVAHCGMPRAGMSASEIAAHCAGAICGTLRAAQTYGT